MATRLHYTMYKSSSQLFPGSLDLVVGEACIARIIPINRFAKQLWAVRSLEDNLHQKLFHSAGEGADAMMDLINWTGEEEDEHA